MSTPDPQIGELWIVKWNIFPFQDYVQPVDANDGFSLWVAIKPGDPIIMRY